MLSRGGQGSVQTRHPGTAGCDECAASPPGAAGMAGSPAGRAGSRGRHCGVRRVRSATVAALRGRRAVTLRRGLLEEDERRRDFDTESLGALCGSSPDAVERGIHIRTPSLLISAQLALWHSRDLQIGRPGVRIRVTVGLTAATAALRAAHRLEARHSPPQASRQVLTREESTIEVAEKLGSVHSRS